MIREKDLRYDISEKDKEETAELFKLICKKIGIPEDAISFGDEDGKYAIYCADKYIDKLRDFFESVEGEEIVKE